MKKQLQTILTTHKMKQQSIFTRLQTHYNKLTQLLQTKGNQFSQFKYQQILNRISRCGLQMKRLGMGMGVCLALGVGTPVVGQVPNFMKHTGASNPIDSVTLSYPSVSNHVQFVDIDGDGDLDMFAAVADSYFQCANSVYFENIGSATSPMFSKQPSTNPLPITDKIYIPEFVDIDNDGDLDCFALGSYYALQPLCNYFENQGTATAPNFVQITGSGNPLDTINALFPFPNSYSLAYLTGGDINNDGATDFWLQETSGAGDVLHFINIGTANNPNLVLQPQGSDPLSFTVNTNSVNNIMGQRMQLIDIDKDGDLDAFSASRPSFSAPYHATVFYENTGSASNPIFATIPTTPTILDSIPILNFTSLLFSTIVDIDADGDFDLFSTEHLTGYSNAGNPYFYYENLDTTITSIHNIAGDEMPFLVYPNPTIGILNFENPITGYFSLYNIAGHKVWEKELREALEINLSELNNGIYFLNIETVNGVNRKKIVIQKY